jgi:hypothetical protein
VSFVLFWRRNFCSPDNGSFESFFGSFLYPRFEENQSNRSIGLFVMYLRLCDYFQFIVEALFHQFSKYIFIDLEENAQFSQEEYQFRRFLRGIQSENFISTKDKHEVRDS